MPHSFRAYGLIMDEADFDTTNDLNSIPFIKKWIKSPKFKRLSILKTMHNKNVLIAEMDGHNCGIGFVSKEFDDLPETDQ